MLSNTYKAECIEVAETMSRIDRDNRGRKPGVIGCHMVPVMGAMSVYRRLCTLKRHGAAKLASEQDDEKHWVLTEDWRKAAAAIESVPDDQWSRQAPAKAANTESINDRLDSIESAIRELSDRLSAIIDRSSVSD